MEFIRVRRSYSDHKFIAKADEGKGMTSMGIDEVRLVPRVHSSLVLERKVLSPCCPTKGIASFSSDALSISRFLIWKSSDGYENAVTPTQYEALNGLSKIAWPGWVGWSFSATFPAFLPPSFVHLRCSFVLGSHYGDSCALVAGVVRTCNSSREFLFQDVVRFKFD